LSGLEKEMGAGAEVMHQVVPLLEAPFHRCSVKSVEVVEEGVGVTTVSPVQPTVLPRAVVEVAVEVADLVSFRFQLPKFSAFMFWQGICWITIPAALPVTFRLFSIDVVEI
jgi:hypothetical protein